MLSNSAAPWNTKPNRSRWAVSSLSLSVGQVAAVEPDLAARRLDQPDQSS